MVSRVELITCPLEATSDNVAATIECEALKKLLQTGRPTVIDSSRKKQVNIIEWRKVEPQLSHLIGVDHEKQGTNQCDMLCIVSCVYLYFVMPIDLLIGCGQLSFICIVNCIYQCFNMPTSSLLNVVTAILNENDHSEIFKTTESACNKWRAIGRNLGFTVDDLDTIVRETGRHEAVDYYEAMLRRWLDWASPNHTPPSLQSLLSALHNAGKSRQANDLEAKYKATGHTGVSVLGSNKVFVILNEYCLLL